MNGRIVETLDSQHLREKLPAFFEPKPVSSAIKNKKNVLFSDNQGNIQFNIKESILGKRKLSDAFDVDYCADEERYGHIIRDDFFTTNIGHNVIQEFDEMLQWCYQYLASKKKL